MTTTVRRTAMEAAVALPETGRAAECLADFRMHPDDA